MQRPSKQLFDAYFTAQDMGEVFSDHGRVQAMLDFEAALARAQARVGVIPQAAVAPIEGACRAEHYDFLPSARRLPARAMPQPTVLGGRAIE